MKIKMIFTLFMASALNAATTEVMQKPEMSNLKVIVPTVLVISPLAVSTSNYLTDVEVIHIEDTFFILKNGKLSKIQPENVDKVLRGITDENIKQFLGNNGFVKLNQDSEGQYRIEAGVRLRGGGVLGGKIAYWAVKSLCWGIVGAVGLAGTGAAVSTGVGAVGALTGASAQTLASTTAILKIGGGAALNTVGGAGLIGAKVTAGVILTNTAATAVATDVVIATTAATGGSAGLIAFIEALSLGAAAVCGAATGPV